MADRPPRRNRIRRPAWSRRAVGTGTAALVPVDVAVQKSRSASDGGRAVIAGTESFSGQTRVECHAFEHPGRRNPA